LSIERQRALIDRGQPKISVVRQCELVGLPRSTYYYEPVGEDDENLKLMMLIDEEYTRHPFLGSPRMTDWLRRSGYLVNHKRVERLMRVMGISAIYPKPHLSEPGSGHRIYPYLLRGVRIDRVDQVWSTDITYIRMRRGFIYLTAVIDWFSRYVLSWEVSTTMDTEFCLSALNWALASGRRPEIFNTDQGSQFTSKSFTDRLLAESIAISMDGRGRALDNVFVERLWRSVKYEEVYLNEYDGADSAVRSLRMYFEYYNNGRPHQSLGYATPAEVYLGKAA
jgi:putative transposase